MAKIRSILGKTKSIIGENMSIVGNPLTIYAPASKVRISFCAHQFSILWDSTDRPSIPFSTTKQIPSHNPKHPSRIQIQKILCKN